jgi:single-stranded-DNA-specific exonuclease
VNSLSHSSEQWALYPKLSGGLFQKGLQAHIDPLQMQILYNRGITTIEAMQHFLAADYSALSDPLQLIDMHKAVERIQHALTHSEHITVYGDYDADGVTSSALLFRALHQLKHPDATLDHHIPHRLRDGCGLNRGALDMLKAKGTQVIITTDCASSDNDQVDYANSLGIDVIITDHHHVPDQLPHAYAIVNPWRNDTPTPSISQDIDQNALEDPYGLRYLCGAGVAFKLVQALYRANKRQIEDEQVLLDLVAIGTIADIVPLLKENHILAHQGMQQLKRTTNAGLSSLIEVARLRKESISERDIAFGIAPRINAAGRMQDASIAFQLLTTDDEARATELAQTLEQLNIERQQKTEALMRDVREQAEAQEAHSIVLVNGEGWHEGLIGLAAGKLAEEIDKPVLVLSDDPQRGLSRGSARSRGGFDIIAALQNFDAYLERYGGHAQAAGFTIRSERIKDLHTYLLQRQNQLTVQEGLIQVTDENNAVLSPESNELTEALAPHMIDLKITREEKLQPKTYRLLQQIGPFGAGYPAPVFKMEHVPLRSLWTSGAQKQNLRLSFSNTGVKGTYSRGAHQQERLTGVRSVNIIFRMEMMDINGKPTLWLNILDVEPYIQQ